MNNTGSTTEVQPRDQRQLNVRVDAELQRSLKRRCVEHGVSMEQQVVNLIRGWLEFEDRIER